jgi:hypothetical protein
MSWAKWWGLVAILGVTNLLGYRLAHRQTVPRPPLVFLITNPARHPFGSPLSSTAYRYSEKQHRINIYRYQVCGSEPLGVSDIPLTGGR